MKRLSWKYIAGIIDGEGCIDFQWVYNKKYPGIPYIRPRVRLTFAEPGKFLLDMFRENFGGGGHEKARSFDNPVWQNAHTWGLHGKQVRPFLQNIVNHLFIKKEQARLALWVCDNAMGKRVSNELREHLKYEMKAMKRDSQRLSETAVSKAKKICPIWSIHSNACLLCGKDNIKHEAKGLCRACYKLSRKHGCDSLANRRLVGSMEP